MKLLSSLLALLSFSLLTVGCGDDPIADFCERITEAGCTFADGVACEDQFGTVAAQAEDKGCDGELADYLDCAAGVLETSCTAGSDGVGAACAPRGVGTRGV